MNGQKSKISALIILLVCLKTCLSLTLSSYLNDGDKTRLREILKLSSPYDSYNLANIYYSLLGSNVLSGNNLNSIITSKEKPDLCSHLLNSLVTNPSEGYNLESLFFATSAAKLLACQIPASASLVTHLQTFQKEDVTVTELYRSAIALTNLGKPVDSNKLSKLLQTALKKDESLASIGLTFQLASKLTGPENLNPFVEKFGDVIVQADEVDSKYLQFEGGLGITATIISGIYNLATAANKPTGLKNDQVIKFTNYFLSRKTVQTVKGAAELLDILSLMTENKYHIPVCISIYGNPALTPSNPVVSIKVTNVLGKSLGKDLSVSGESPVWTGKKLFEPVQGDSTMFAINFLEKKPKRGSYDVSVIVTPSKSDPRLIGNTNALVKVAVLTQVVVHNPEIGVADRDQVTSFRMTKLTYPNLLQEALEADYQQKLVMKFALKDKNAGDMMTAHQVFIQFLNEEAMQEIIFVAETETSTGDVYKFDLDLSTRAKDFSSKSGKYILSLIVGDPVISNNFVWKVATVKMSFPPSQSITQDTPRAPWMDAHYGPKPEIKHHFREQEKRPAKVVSDTFSGLVLAPILILFILWAKIGANLSNFSFTVSALVFHISFAGILLLYVCFYLHLNMFSTIKYLIGIGLITFLSGHRLLSSLNLSSQKQQQK